MALSQQTLQQQRDDLQSALNSGALTVQHDGKTVTYRDRVSMIRQLADIDQQISGKKPKSIQYLQLGTGDVDRSRRRDGW